MGYSAEEQVSYVDSEAECFRGPQALGFTSDITIDLCFAGRDGRYFCLLSEQLCQKLHHG